MNRIRFATMLIAAAAVTACDNDPIALDPVPAAVQILGIADTLVFGDTLNATVDVRNADNVRLTQVIAQWSSSDPAVLNVSENGRINAMRPGSAYLRAQAGAVQDSVRIRIVTTVLPSACSPQQDLPDVGNNFAHSRFHPGSIHVPETVFSQYMGVNAVYAGGVRYGVDAQSLVAGWGPPVGHDLVGRVCLVDDNNVPFHVVSLLEESRMGLSQSSGVPGLRVINDVYAFNGPTTDDFLLLRYEFTNETAAPILDLHVGQDMDFDLHSTVNVGSFDAATGVADVIAADSVTNPMVVGFLAVDETVVSYYGAATPGVFSRADLFSQISASGTAHSRIAGGMDVQVIGVAPFDLQPGESRNVWFAIVGGENRAAFNQHVAQAIATARLLD